MLMGVVVKTVSLRPTTMPGTGCWSQPAWIAVRTERWFSVSTLLPIESYSMSVALQLDM